MNVFEANESTLGNSSTLTKSSFACPVTPYLTWQLNHEASIQSTIAVTSIACPATIFLNILVILAVKKTKMHKRNSNILLSNLAKANLVVGAFAMPLTAALDVLLLSENVAEDAVCTLDSVGDYFIYTPAGISLFLLILIA